LRVLLLDLTHGAEVLAREYLRRGQDVTCVDVYHTAPDLLKGRLRAEGIRVLEEAPSERFDLLVAPIHCPDVYLPAAGYRTRLTHHEAVGELCSFPFPTVEVTGAGGKTTTCHVLARGNATVDEAGWRLTREGFVEE